MFNCINLRFPRFTFRTFLFVLFGLVLLVLLVEGGYYYFSQIRKGARLVNTVWDELIEGQINEIKGKTLVITVKDNSLIPKKVEIEVASDARIFIVPPRDLLEKVLSAGEEERMSLSGQLEVAQKSIKFTDLKVGDTIQAGILTKLTKTKFKAESIAVIKE